jgi:hypothetical protein
MLLMLLMIKELLAMEGEDTNKGGYQPTRGKMKGGLWGLSEYHLIVLFPKS